MEQVKPAPAIPNNPPQAVTVFPEFHWDKCFWKTAADLPSWRDFKSRDDAGGNGLIKITFAPEGRDDAPLNPSEIEMVRWVIAPQSANRLPYFGITFRCTWDEEHGAGVLMHGTRVVEIGGVDTAILLWMAKENAERAAKNKHMETTPPKPIKEHARMITRITPPLFKPSSGRHGRVRRCQAVGIYPTP